MSFYFHVPSPPLDRFIEHFWLLDSHPPTSPKDQIFPDGGIEIMFNLGEPQRLFTPGAEAPFTWFRGSWVSGMRTRSIVISQLPRASMVGVRFRPWGARRFLAVPMTELANRVIELDGVWGKFAEEVRERLGSSASQTACFATLETLLLRKLAEDRQEDRVAAWVGIRVQSQPDTVDMDALANRLGVSRKLVQRAFATVVGVSPKAFARVQRFQLAIRSIGRRPTVDWASLASRCGYFDQAHLINEFKEFTALTPTAYLSRRGPFLNYVAAD